MEDSGFHFPLFPHKARLIGILLLIPGFFSGYLYFFGGRPDFFQIPVFAIATTYAENRFFVIAQTNLLDELFVLLCLSGLALIVFSKERNEKEGYDLIRAKALIRAVYISLAIWMLSFLVIFGWAIFLVSAMVFIIFLITYYIVFRVLLNRSNQAQHRWGWDKIGQEGKKAGGQEGKAKSQKT